MLARLITENALRTLAGEKSFQRGAAYFARGSVISLVDTGETVKARVVGSDEYKVSLSANGKSLAHTCTCPVGEDGEFCKHAVAAGLAWLARRQGGSAGAGYTGKTDFDAIRTHLEGLERKTLVELLMEQVAEDDGLRSRLSVRTARKGGAADDPRALKDTVRKALAVQGFTDYHGMRKLIERAQPVAELLRGMIAEGEAPAAVELADYALHQGLSAYERTDDSSGSFGDLLREMAQLHLDACRKAQPEPKSLGKSFFTLQLRDHWGFFEWKDYAPLLGEAGRETYRALAEKEWAKVPARGPQVRGERFDTQHFVITRVMEELARERGDVDGLVAVKSRDLSHSHAFLDIAQFLAAVGRRDEALAWAERGRAAFGNELNWSLVEYLAAEYRRRRRFDDAAALAWEHFTAHAGLRAYQLLKTCAGGAKAWTAWREKVLAWLRESDSKDKSRRLYPGGRSLLVEIFLSEGDSDAALAEARGGGCTRDLWFKLAAAGERDHPADAAAIYRQHLDGIVERKNNDAYDDGAELVGKIRTLMRRMKQEKEFAAWLADVRARHKAKRNFMQRLDRIS